VSKCNYRISQDGNEIKLLGKWYDSKEIISAVQLYEEAKKLIPKQEPAQ